MKLDIQNTAELEHRFAEDFGTPLFPILADQYLKSKKFKKARKVCELGLKNAPHNTDGKYVLAKINLYENKVVQGERLLKQVIDENPVHVNAMRVLIEVMRSLKRSHKSIQKHLHQLLKILPEDEEALSVVNALNVSISENKTVQTESAKSPNEKDHLETIEDTTKSDSVKPTLQSGDVNSIESPTFIVGAHMATFTLVGVLRAQKHYRQALAVLSRIEGKGGDPDRIGRERKDLESLLFKVE